MLLELTIVGGVLYLVSTGRVKDAPTAMRLAGRYLGRAAGSARRLRADILHATTQAAYSHPDLQNSSAALKETLAQFQAVRADAASLASLRPSALRADILQQYLAQGASSGGGGSGVAAGGSGLPSGMSGNTFGAPAYGGGYGMPGGAAGGQPLAYGADAAASPRGFGVAAGEAAAYAPAYNARSREFSDEEVAAALASVPASAWRGGEAAPAPGAGAPGGGNHAAPQPGAPEASSSKLSSHVVGGEGMGDPPAGAVAVAVATGAGAAGAGTLPPAAQPHPLPPPPAQAPARPVVKAEFLQVWDSGSTTPSGGVGVEAWSSLLAAQHDWVRSSGGVPGTTQQAAPVTSADSAATSVPSKSKPDRELQ